MSRPSRWARSSRAIVLLLERHTAPQQKARSKLDITGMPPSVSQPRRVVLVWIRQIRVSRTACGEFARRRPGHLPAHLVGVRSVGKPGQVGCIGDRAAIDEMAHGGNQPLPADGGRERHAGLLFAQSPEVIG